jgi:hypothetical protein
MLSSHLSVTQLLLECRQPYFPFFRRFSPSYLHLFYSNLASSSSSSHFPPLKLKSPSPKVKDILLRFKIVSSLKGKYFRKVSLYFLVSNLQFFFFSSFFHCQNRIFLFLILCNLIFFARFSFPFFFLIFDLLTN